MVVKRKEIEEDIEDIMSSLSNLRLKKRRRSVPWDVPSLCYYKEVVPVSRLSLKTRLLLKAFEMMDLDT